MMRTKPEGPGRRHRSKAPDTLLIVIRISASENWFPAWTQGSKSRGDAGDGYIQFLLLDRTERLVSNLAHEFRHLWQIENSGNKKGRVWGSKGTLSDRDADQYAIRKAQEYRHENNLRLLREQPLSYLL
jgi:hypothetical protein